MTLKSMASGLKSIGFKLETSCVSSELHLTNFIVHNFCLLGIRSKLLFNVAVFVYAPDADSVLLVNETAYRNCDTSTPIDTFDDGNTVFVFTRSGSYHFISGNRDNCLKNESLVVVVMANRRNRSGQAPSPSASPSSSPPAPGSVEIVPSSPPNGEGSSSSPPPPNGAPTKVVGLMASVGALMGSLFFLL